MPNRFIKPDSIRMGDLVRVTGKYQDVDIARTGYMVKRDHQGRTTTYYSAAGVELLSVYGDGTTSPERAKVTLITRPMVSSPFPDSTDESPTLFD